ncbi:hypothetical protein B9Z55_024614 [Caenorhabditis nigoni]|uniref:Uncharacterized protein n=1 Tax=Caenorhabditis nigoni TaxID=1611254 RepID=A0A2G5SVH9_9PELO|nr:hypothetical protein B9Z55_024614 [Caenorhabditis nigoni]
MPRSSSLSANPKIMYSIQIICQAFTNFILPSRFIKAMEPLLTTEVQLYQDKLIGKKWKSYIASFFEENALGKARIELFQSDGKKKEPVKTLLLENVVSLKPGKTDGGAAFVKVQYKDDSYVQFSSEELQRVMDVLSNICFPKKMQYVTIAPSTSLDSPTEEEEYFEFPDTYTMLKLKQVNGRESTEGVYKLSLNQSLQISGNNNIHCIPYQSIQWVGTGEHCVGFGIENLGTFEFATGDALLFVEHLRSFIRFSCDFSTPQVKMICRFNRYFHPNRLVNSTSPGLSNNSTMESVDSGGVYSKIPGSTDTSVSSLQLNEAEFVNRVVKNELRRNASMEMLRHKISFLQKKKNESRTDFEESADRDFVRVQLPKGILLEQNKFSPTKSVSFQDMDSMTAENKIYGRHTDL